MTDVHAKTVQVAQILASRGFSARVVPNSQGHSVEVSVDDTTRALWSLGDLGWGYLVLGFASGGYGIISQGVTEVGSEASPDQVAWVISGFPYSAEMSDEEARAAVSDLLSQVEGLTDEEREGILSSAIPPADLAEPLAWGDLADSGMLWAINRYILNPSGLSMVLRYEGGAPTGWSILGSGHAPVSMDPLADQNGAARYISFVTGLSRSAGEE